MSGLRRILGDRLASGLLVAVLAWALVLQGLLGAEARAATAGPGFDPLAALCNGLGGPDGEPAGPGLRPVHDCCTTACQAACAAPAALAAGDLGPAFTQCSAARTGWRTQAERASPRLLGLLCEARGPPARFF